jgi:MoxR-like ATPase
MPEANWSELATKLRGSCLEPIKQTLIGKEEIVEVMGVALVSGENAFLLGPPGTGKSALVHEFARKLGGRNFDYLLTRFTEPSELFGPFDLRRLRDGDLVTNTEGMLPEADFVFLDELLNANSAVLNSLLLALNERVFRRGRETRRLPMLMAVGASNRLPEDDALAALFDRFLLRVTCGNVDTERMLEVLDAGWLREQTRVAPNQPETSPLQVEDVRTLQQAVQAVSLDNIRPSYVELIRRLRESGMPLSDRRIVRLQRVIAASAVVCGRLAADVSDLWIMRYIWETPAQTEMLEAHVEAIRKEFATDDSTETAEHPLASQPHGPDPELLFTALETLVAARDNGDKTDAAILDSLSLLAARVEWVQLSDAREHLRERIQRLRSAVQLGEAS